MLWLHVCGAVVSDMFRYCNRVTVCVCVQDERWEVELQREKLRQQEDQLKVDTVY